MPDLEEHRERTIGYTTEFWGVVTRKQAGCQQAGQWWGGDSKAWGRGAMDMKCSRTGHMGGQDLGDVWMLRELWLE